VCPGVAATTLDVMQERLISRMDDIISQKRCSKCKEPKSLDDFPPLDAQTLAKRPVNSKQQGRKSACRECIRASGRDYWRKVGRHKDPSKRKKYKLDPQKSRQLSIKKNYGMTSEEYQSMLDRQNGLCASCNNPETAKGNTGKLKPLAVDHDHVTGKVRSLLCSNCNQALGCLKEDPERVNALLRYIKQYVL
jgi:Autographiviridae endonuclease VII